MRGRDEPLWPGNWPNTFGTNLARAGVPPKVAQELMRHSDVKLTLNTYSHVGLHDLAGAVEQLPALPTLAPSVAAETGTEQAAPSVRVAPRVALKTGNPRSSQELSEVTDEQAVELTDDSGVRHKPRRGQEVTAFESAHKKEPPVRLELTTYALRKRRSAN